MFKIMHMTPTTKTTVVQTFHDAICGTNPFLTAL